MLTMQCSGKQHQVLHTPRTDLRQPRLVCKGLHLLQLAVKPKLLFRGAPTPIGFWANYGPTNLLSKMPNLRINPIHLADVLAAVNWAELYSLAANARLGNGFTQQIVDMYAAFYVGQTGALVHVGNGDHITQQMVFLRGAGEAPTWGSILVCFSPSG